MNFMTNTDPEIIQLDRGKLSEENYASGLIHREMSILEIPDYNYKTTWADDELAMIH